MKNIHAVIVDYQNDFCNPKGALYVKGADEDVKRATNMVKRLGKKISQYHLTMDSHREIDIAHSVWWLDKNNQHPTPFTLITAKDVEDGVWRATKRGLQQRSLDYVKALETNGRYACVIWPTHVLIGTWGNNFVPEFHDAIREWERDNFRVANIVTKGSNIFTEHFSAIIADVPDPSDHTTQLNRGLLTTLEEADELIFFGQASSHCCRNTLFDIIDNFSDPQYKNKLVIIKDAMSPVPSFENLETEMYDRLQKENIRVTTTTDYLA